MIVAVAGLGLIGGSVGLAARERLGAHVRGWDPDRTAADEALGRGAVDEASESPSAASAGADLVVVAAPVGVLPAAVSEALAAAGPDAAVTDVGSVKLPLAGAMDDPRFVGGHPLAGAETSGVAHARADLFEGATWYLTPGPTTSGTAIERVTHAVARIGARPAAIDAATHDRMLASVSHLPHVLANALVGQAAGVLGAEALPRTGPSFRDATRVAGASTAIWADIYLANADALGELLDDAIERLGEVRRRLAAGDRPWIERWNEDAARDRRRLLEAQLAGGEVHELRVSVPNRPGVVAEVALELGRTGVNITDMALYPAADLSGGVIALWIAGAPDAARAEELIGALGHPVVRA